MLPRSFWTLDTSSGLGMRVGQHPHCGLQTLTWLLAGEVLHRDSLGSLQHIRPGQMNLMTAGQGISHSEESPRERPSELHGAQLWIALPDAERRREPAFDHYPDLPVIDRNDARITLLVGALFGERSPARIYSPLIGLDIAMPHGGVAEVPVNPNFQNALLPLEGAVTFEAEPFSTGTLLYLGCGRSSITCAAHSPARMLLLGGAPFGEEILMWWNFVARSRAEITEVRRAWNAAENAFGEVSGYGGERLTAPALSSSAA